MRLSRSDRLRAYVALALLSFFNGFLGALRLCFWPRRPRRIERIGVYRIGNIGDIVCAVPALYTIRRTYPKARLTLVTSPGKQDAPGARELLGDAEWIDELMIYYLDVGKGSSDLVEQIRKRHFDLWIVLPPTPGQMRRLLRDMLAARFAGVRWGYGWQLDYLRLWGNAQSSVFTFPKETEWLMSIVKQAGMNAKEYAFPLALASVGASVDALFRVGENTHRTLVAIAPGAKRSTNRWPIERFREVAASLAERGFGVVLLGAAGDAAACAQVASAAGDKALNLAGRNSLLETCEILRRCRLLVCNDSGVQHLAAAVGTPCLSIFSCRDFRGRWWPYGEQNVVLQKWVPCGTCLVEVCPYDNHCLKLIESGEVLDHATRMLERPLVEN